MSRSYWLPVLAIGGFLATAVLAAGADEQPRAPQSVAGRQSAQSNQGPRQSAVSSPGAQVENPAAEEREPDTYDPAKPCDGYQTTKGSDLCQQWRMAEAAETQVRLIWLNNWFLGGEAVLLAFTFAFTAYTALMGFRTSRSELRAYVYPDGVTLTEGTKLIPPQPHRANVPGVAIIFKNSGNTPANEFVSWAAIEIEKPINEPRLVPPEVGNAFPANLPPGGTTSKALWYHRALTAAEIADVQNGTQGIYVYGAIEYVDGFKKRHRTNFRLVYINGQFPPQPNPVLHYCVGGNEAT